MSRKANVTLIGFFVLGALVAALGGVIFFGSLRWFEKNNLFVLYFNESVNGLEAGSAVKFRGVPIGKVKDILIRTEQQPAESTHIPVLVEIDTNRVSRLGVKRESFDITDPAQLANAIDLEGLRAQLQMESFITGLYYIELDYYLDPPLYDPIQTEPPEYLEIPSIPSPLAAVEESGMEILAKIGAFDFAGLSSELNALLRRMNQKLDDVDLAGLSEELRGTLKAVRGRVEAEEIDRLLANLNTSAEALQEVVKKVDGKVEPLLEEATGAAAQLKATLVTVDDTVAVVRGVAERADLLLAPESSLRQQMERALRELGDAARATRLLVNYLERNPKALITGKAGEGP